jgi:hypothetical protein
MGRHLYMVLGISTLAARLPDCYLRKLTICSKEEGKQWFRRGLPPLDAPLFPLDLVNDADEGSPNGYHLSKITVGSVH